MYTLYADDVVLFQSDISDREYFLGKPEVNLDLGKVGAVNFTIYPSHPEYDNIKALITRIKVTKDDGKIVYIGRVLDITKGTWREKQCVCEDALGFLNDGYIGKLEKQNMTPHNFFRKCIQAHNASVSADKRLTIGTLSLDEGDVEKEFEIRSYSRVKNVLDSNLLNMYGGYLNLRYNSDGSVVYVDYVQKFDQMAGQTIEFAKNLIDIEDKLEGADIFTAMIATGKDGLEISEAATSRTKNIGRGITIQTVAGDPVIRIPDAIAKYGYIYRIEQFSSKETAVEVLSEAEKYILNNYRNVPNTLNIKAIDMHLLNGSIDDIWIGKKVRIISNPHGVDMILLCVGIKIDIQNPENTTYEFGDPTQQTSEQTTQGSTSNSGGGGGGGSLSGGTAGIGQACLWDGEDIDISKHEIILRAEENMLLEAKTMELKADLLVTDTNMAQVWTNSFLVMGGRLSQGDDGAYYDDRGNLILDANGKFAAGVDEAKYLVLKQAYELLHHVNPETGEEEPITFSALTTDVNLIGKNLTQAQMDILTNAEGIAGNRTMIDGHAATLTAINTDITNITSRVTTIGGDLDAAEIEIAQQGRSITAIKSDITVIGNNLTQAQRDIVANKTSIDGHAATLTAINTDITNITSRVTTIGGDLDADELTIAAQGRSITSIKSDITNINSSVTNINSEITNIKGKLNADWIAARVGELDRLSVKALGVSGGMDCRGSVTVNKISVGTMNGGFANLSNCFSGASIKTESGTTTISLIRTLGHDSNLGTVTLSFKTADSVTVSGSWASGVFTAKASNGKSQQTETLTKGGETWDGTTCSFPVLSYINGNSYTARQTGKTFSVLCSSKLETKTITSNGTYTPSSGKIGFSKVTVSITDPHTFEERTFSSNGTYYASTYGKSGFSKVVVSVNTSTETKTITSNGTYTPSSGKIGFSKVVVNITTHDTAVYNCVKGASQAKVSGSHFKGYAYYKSGSSYYKLYDYERYWYYSSSSNTPTTYYS